MSTPTRFDDTSKYYPAAFPSDLPTINLERISITDLFDPSTAQETSQKIFRILSTAGFFYLDLLDDEIDGNNDNDEVDDEAGDSSRGRAFWQLACKLHDAGKDVFRNTPMKVKESWAAKPFEGVLDQGYRAFGKDADGEPDLGEMVNVPTNELLNDASYTLPPWLQTHQDDYREFARQANEIGQALLQHLESPLGLTPGSLTSLYTLSPTTGGFVRTFRYPPLSASRPASTPLSPAHTDGNGITILFNWQGGLQISRPESGDANDAASVASRRELKATGRVDARDEWLWVQPRRGCALVNVGDPMVVFTNGVLRSGFHRVVAPPGEQGRFERVSLLAGLRPRGDAVMRALRSEVIPKETEEQRGEGVVTAHEWAVERVTSIIKQTERR